MELAFFAMREHRVVDLERKAGCAYCDAGINCEFGPSCRGQTALRRSKTTKAAASYSTLHRDPLPRPRVRLRKRGRKRPRGKKKLGRSDQGTGVGHAQEQQYKQAASCQPALGAGANMPWS